MTSIAAPRNLMFRPTMGLKRPPEVTGLHGQSWAPGRRPHAACALAPIVLRLALGCPALGKHLDGRPDAQRGIGGIPRRALTQNVAGFVHGDGYDVGFPTVWIS